ncbi:MAG: peptidoglycan-associated lipoprotein Pal [Syntrophales bacterium]
MRRKRLWAVLAVMALFLSAAFVSGCTKKSGLKNHTMVHGEEKPMVQAPAKARIDDRGATESALREQELRERALREQTLGERAAGGTTSESARREAAGRENEAAALLKDLQIPDIHFDFDEYTIKPESQAILKTGAQAYLKYTQYKLLIEGHCDERGTVEYNLALGQKRADEAARYLMALGIAKERIRSISYGKEKPLDPGHDEMALARNRRDHFVVSESVE